MTTPPPGMKELAERLREATQVVVYWDDERGMRHPYYLSEDEINTLRLAHQEDVGQTRIADGGQRNEQSVPKPSPAQCWPRKGDKMKFLGVHGYDYQLKEALAKFDTHTLYTVVRCDVGDWSHSIQFEEIEGEYNGVMFEMAQPNPHQPHAVSGETELIERCAKIADPWVGCVGLVPDDEVTKCCREIAAAIRGIKP